MVEVTTQRSSESSVVVVDLDGTLLKGDILLESLLVYLLRAPWRFFLILAWLGQGGRALMKARLADRVVLDGTLLPWNQEVVNFCQDQVRAGRSVVVATASNEKAAGMAIAHFTFITRVFGSSASNNLKGEKKAEFLQKEFGSSGFDYIGDERVDLPVWKKASKAWFVGAESRRKNLEQISGKPLSPLCGSNTFDILNFLKALRPHQWLKNLLVFIPILAAHRWSEEACWRQIIPVFFALCCMASSSYLLNDLADLEADRRHSRKKTRPFASGDLDLSKGVGAIAVLFLAGMALASLSGFASGVSMVLYFVFSVLYSLAFKKIPVFDTLFLSGLYTYRIVLGGITASVMISPWLLAFSTTFFLGLAFLKRYVELEAHPAGSVEKIPGRGYIKNDLVFVLVSGLSSNFLSVVVLALYLDSSASSALYRSPHWLWGIGLVLLFWIIRVWFLAGRRQMNDDPVWFAAKDPVTLVLALICLAFIVVAGPV